MGRMRTILRLLCILGMLWSALCCASAAFLLSEIPLAQGETIEAAGLALDADIAYTVAGAALLAAALFTLAACAFGLRCVRLMRHMDLLRALALVGFVLFAAALIAQLALGRIHGIGWMPAIGGVAAFSVASFAGEVSRALIAARMRMEAGDEL